MFASRTLALPMTTSVPALRSSPSTPRFIRFTTPRERSTAFAQSSVTPWTPMPKLSALSWTKWTISAFLISAFVGMQPQFRQTPPRFGSRSMTTAFSPSWPARMPAT